MILLNGRGQIGSALKLIEKDTSDLDVIVYHTWNFLDKSLYTQKNEFEKLYKYLINRKEDKKFVFISTKSKSINYYTEYKKLAETLVEEVCKSYLIIRLPNLLGKGICSRFKEEKNILAIGQIELLTIDDAIKLIINNIKYNSNSIVELQGTNIDASLLQNIIKFGSK